MLTFAYPQVQLAANWVYIGPEEEGRKVLAPILALNPVSSSINMVAWNILIASIGDHFDQLGCTPEVIRDLYNLNLRNYSADTFQSSFTKMAQFFADNPGGRNSNLLFEFFPNQAMAAVPADETAYPWRDSIGYM
jgi:hypothetical protein